jgi:outer membrane receptor for ferrienterochelin and colicin
MTNQILLEVAYVFCTDTKNNGNLKPEMTISREIGLEMSFLNNRFGFDASYYHTNTVDQIIPVAVSLRLVIQVSSLMRVISRIKVSNCPYLERLLEPKFFLERKC